MTGDTEQLDEAFRAYAEKDVERAAELLSGITIDDGPGRTLKIQVLTDLGRHTELLDLVQDPRNADELMVLTDALCRVRLYQQAKDALREGADRFALSSDIREQIGARIAVAEMGR